MHRYHGKPELTDEAYDGERWLKTGYVCTCSETGALRVLGKRNSFLEPLPGRLVCAQRLETIYAHRCPLVHQIWCHCSAGRPIVAVVALDQEVLFRWHRAQRLDLRQRAENAPRIAAAVLSALEGVAAESLVNGGYSAPALDSDQRSACVAP